MRVSQSDPPEPAPPPDETETARPKKIGWPVWLDPFLIAAAALYATVMALG
jgi:hypothetical protein